MKIFLDGGPSSGQEIEVPDSFLQGDKIWVLPGFAGHWLAKHVYRRTGKTIGGLRVYGHGLVGSFWW